MVSANFSSKFHVSSLTRPSSVDIFPPAIVELCNYGRIRRHIRLEMSKIKEKGGRRREGKSLPPNGNYYSGNFQRQPSSVYPSHFKVKKRNVAHYQVMPASNIPHKSCV